MTNMLNLKFFKELIAIGLMVIIIGFIVAYLLAAISNDESIKSKLNSNPKLCATWLFFTGVFTHLFCEVSGLNKWYCKNGNAC